MAKKKTNKKSSTDTSPEDPAKSAAEEKESPAVFERLGRQIDDLPYVEDAERALVQAQQQLRKARRRYQQVRRKAKKEIGEARDKKLSELTDEGMEFVRHYPGISVAIAAAFGFFFGRLFRR